MALGIIPEVELVIPKPSGVGTVVVQDEEVELPNRQVLNFVGDDYVFTDDPENNQIVVTVVPPEAPTMNVYWALDDGTAPVDSTLILSGASQSTEVSTHNFVVSPNEQYVYYAIPAEYDAIMTLNGFQFSVTEVGTILVSDENYRVYRSVQRLVGSNFNIIISPETHEWPV